MAFIIDKQTLNDLKIFGKMKGSSIYGLFNMTRTRGGSVILEEMFRYPLSDVDKINNRTAIIRFFMEKQVSFPFRNDWFDTIEHYLSNTDERTRLHLSGYTLRWRMRNLIGADMVYQQLHKGALASIALLNATSDFIRQLGSIDEGYKEESQALMTLVNDPLFAWVKEERGVRKLSYAKMVKYDAVFRYEGIELFRKILRLLYNLDVYITVASVARKQGYTFAKAFAPGDNLLKMEGMYHPLLKNPVPNSLSVDADHNLVFLTGANMAGKSTFMKTFGVVVYLAHMGFPVPAKSMEFSVQNGMCTTINLPDNMSLGYSHFYAEVQRLKKVSEQVGRIGNLIIVFDELFRGTNVKDAHEATVEVMKAFAEKRNCIFMISTHIIEAGADLKKVCDNIRYVYLPTVMQADGKPKYTYTLTEGITDDRHGMMIVRNEHIIDILNSKL